METETVKTLKPGDPEYGELIFSARKYSVGGKFRAAGRRYFACANHRQNGELISQFFDDIWQRRSSMDDTWDLVESGEEKVKAFAESERVANARPIPEAASHEQALAIAKEQYGMSVIEPAGRGAA